MLATREECVALSASEGHERREESAKESEERERGVVSVLFRLSRLTKVKLQILCRQLEVPVKGNKKDVVERLLLRQAWV